MKIKWKTDQQIAKANEKLAKHGLKTKAKKGEKNSQYLDRLAKEINKNISFGHIDRLSQ